MIVFGGQVSRIAQVQESVTKKLSCNLTPMQLYQFLKHCNLVSRVLPPLGASSLKGEKGERGEGVRCSICSVY